MATVMVRGFTAARASLGVGVVCGEAGPRGGPIPTAEVRDVSPELLVPSEADDTDDCKKRLQDGGRASRLHLLLDSLSGFCRAPKTLLPPLPPTAQAWHAVPCSKRAVPMPHTSSRPPTVAEDVRLNAKASYDLGESQRPITAPIHTFLTSPARSHPNAAHAKELPLHLILRILDHVRNNRPLSPHTSRTTR
jgi:hypothetical protein